MTQTNTLFWIAFVTCSIPVFLWSLVAFVIIAKWVRKKVE